MPTQNVNLTSKLENFVKKQVEGGYFNNASEVHRAALAAMARHEEEREARIERLKAAAQLGVDDIDAGRSDVLESDPELAAAMDASFARAMQRLENTDAEPLA